MIGTHTHMPTADTRILPGGTAYQTDAGMTGPYHSVIGVEKQIILERFLTQIAGAHGSRAAGAELHGVMVEVDEATGRATAIRRIDSKLSRAKLVSLKDVALTFEEARAMRAPKCAPMAATGNRSALADAAGRVLAEIIAATAIIRRLRVRLATDLRCARRICRASCTSSAKFARAKFSKDQSGLGRLSKS